VADAAQRQRKLAAKVARRTAVLAERKKLETSSGSLAARIRVASKGTIVRCLVPSTLFDIGIGHVILARALPTGLLGCAFFLVDVYCLGVKDVFYADLDAAKLQSRIHDMSGAQKFVDADPACARKLIRGAAAYAAKLGLVAARDTPVIETIFGDVDADACPETFVFGKDGKPFYMSGPNDTPARIRAITRTLESKCGPDGWHFMVEGTNGL